MKVKSISGLLVLGASFLIAFPARSVIGAEGQAERKPQRAPAAAVPEGPGLGPGGGRFGPGYQRLVSVLTDEQKASLRGAMDDEREKARELEDRFRAATRDLYVAGLAPNFNEESVREKALAAAKAEAELSVLRFKAFSKMRPQLTAEQIRNLRLAERTDRPRPNEGGDTGSIQGELPHQLPVRSRDENGLPITTSKSN
jgi:Spy/CpxP family protein refolding chaperone